jgi:hypothetical protein
VSPRVETGGRDARENTPKAFHCQSLGFAAAAANPKLRASTRDEL